MGNMLIISAEGDAYENPSTCDVFTSTVEKWKGKRPLVCKKKKKPERSEKEAARTEETSGWSSDDVV